MKLFLETCPWAASAAEERFSTGLISIGLISHLPQPSLLPDMTVELLWIIISNLYFPAFSFRTHFLHTWSCATYWWFGQRLHLPPWSHEIIMELENPCCLATEYLPIIRLWHNTLHQYHCVTNCQHCSVQVCALGAIGKQNLLPWSACGIGIILGWLILRNSSLGSSSENQLKVTLAKGPLHLPGQSPCVRGWTFSLETLSMQKTACKPAWQRYPCLLCFSRWPSITGTPHPTPPFVFSCRWCLRWQLWAILASYPVFLGFSHVYRRYTCY